MQLNESDIHKYQNKAISAIEKNHKYYLALDLGLGKTAIGLTAITRIKPNRTLIIGPKRVMTNVWEAEALKWSHTEHLTFDSLVGMSPKKRLDTLLNSFTDITLCNVELFVWLLKELKTHKVKWPFDMLILDEAHVFKNGKSVRFKEIRKVCRQFQRVVLMSATPASNTLLDLWSQMFILDQGERLNKHIGHYKNTYFDSDYMGYNWTLKPGADEQIYEKLDDIMMSMSAEDYLDLPELINNPVRISLDTKEYELYKQFKKDAIMLFKEENEVVTAVNAAVLSSRLLQFASGTAYSETKETIVLHNKKVDALKEVLEDLNGKTTLLAYKYKSDLAILRKEFPEFVHIDDNKETVDDWNEGKIPVLLVNPQSAGAGLNLQRGGHNIIIYTPDFSYQNETQFLGRLHRQGQQHPVVVHRLIVNDTMDEKVIESLENKKQGQNALLEAIKEEIENE